MTKPAKHATKCVGTVIDQSHPSFRAHGATVDNIIRLDILFLTYRRAGRTPGLVLRYGYLESESVSGLRPRQ